MGMWRTIGCRLFQMVFHLGALCLPWRMAERVEGAGAIREIPGLLRREQVRRPMLVTTPGRRAQALPALCAALEEAGMSYAIFDAVGPDPTVSVVEAIRTRYQEAGCDSFVAVGGGSPIDAAKAAAARLVRPGRTVAQLCGLLRVRRRIPPFIAVPTTAGSGSETTIAAVITDEATRHKAAIMDLCLVPHYAVLDPTLTLGLPPHITAATGMDALTHAVEAYLCRFCRTRQTIRWAEEAVALIFRHLEQVYVHGEDVQGRMDMLRAAYLAGAAFTRSGVGNVHAIAHTLGGLYHTPHGQANAAVLPVVLEDYGEAVWPRLARLAELAGIADQGSREGMARAFLQAIREMNCRMGLPQTFAYIQDSDIPQMAAWACAEANPIYPVPVVYTPRHAREVIARLKGH